VAVGVAGLRVAVGVTGAAVGVSVTSGVGVMVGVSVGVGVGVYTGVAVCVEVGVKVGLGVLVGVGVSVGAAMNDVREQPRTVTIAMAIKATQVSPILVLVILYPADLLTCARGAWWQVPR